MTNNFLKSFISKRKNLKGYSPENPKNIKYKTSKGYDDKKMINKIVKRTLNQVGDESLVDLNTVEIDEKTKYVKETLNRLLNSNLEPPMKKTIAFVLRKSPEYDIDYLIRIIESLKKNVTVDVEYVCISDVDVSDICTWIQFENDWPGWWSKLELFSHPYLKGKDIIYFDLDTVINRNIDHLITYNHKFSMLRDFLFKQRYGSGIMAWSGDRSYITRAFDLDVHPQKYVTSEDWGDQAFIRDNVREKIEIIQDLTRVKVGSYKKTPNRRSMDIICFHGKPRPRDVKWRI